MINCNVCTSVMSVLRLADVNDIFDYMRKPIQYYSEPLVIKKKKKKELLKTFEQATRNTLTNFENLPFFPCFYNIVLKQSNWYFLNHLCI